MRMLVNWVVSALAVWLVAYIVPGVSVTGITAALLAALVIGFVNATLGALLKLVTFPLTVLTLGLMWLIINGLMFELAAAIVPGFNVAGFKAAFLGALVLSLVNMILRWLVKPAEQG